MHLTKSLPLPFLRSTRRWLIQCEKEAPIINSSFQPDHISMDSGELRAERGWALQRRVVSSAYECMVPLHSRAGIWDSAAFPRMMCCSLAVVAFQLDRFSVEDSKTHTQRKPKEGCFMQGGGFLGGKGGLLGGCCVSMEVCKEEKDGDDETPVFEVLSLNEK